MSGTMLPWSEAGPDLQAVGLELYEIKKRYAEVVAAGEDPLTVLGVKCEDSRWWVDPEHPGFQALVPRIRPVPSHWDGNDLIQQKGLYFLRDVTALLPFTGNQMRYRVQKDPHKARTEAGLFKDEETGHYVVDMERFGPWITQLWQSVNKQ